jgi:hypothetical protein
MTRSRLTDDEILAIRLYDGDPHASYDLLSPDQIPDEPKWLRLVAIYRSADLIRCARPHCGQPHNEGAVVAIELPDGGEGLINIGHDCGAELFPEEFKAGSARFSGHLEHRGRAEAKRDAVTKELLLHRNLIIRKREILRRRPEIDAWFERVRQPFSDYDSARRRFESCMPDLFEQLSSVARSNGQLVVYQAPKKSKLRQELEGQRGKLWDDVWDIVHVLAGPRFFDRGELVERMEKAAIECADILDRLQPDDLSVQTMQNLTGRLASIGELLHRMTTQYFDMFSALSAANLQGVARWHRRYEHWSPYLYTKGGLLRQTTKGFPEFHLKAIADRPLEVIGFPIAKIA